MAAECASDGLSHQLAVETCGATWWAPQIIPQDAGIHPPLPVCQQEGGEGPQRPRGRVLVAEHRRRQARQPEEFPERPDSRPRARLLVRLAQAREMELRSPLGPHLVPAHVGGAHSRAADAQRHPCPVWVCVRQRGYWHEPHRRAVEHPVEIGHAGAAKLRPRHARKGQDERARFAAPGLLVARSA